MADMLDLVEDVMVTLENEGKFYKWCEGNLKACSYVHFGNAMGYYYAPAKKLNDAARVYLRNYFTWRWICVGKGPEPVYSVAPLAGGDYMDFKSTSRYTPPKGKDPWADTRYAQTPPHTLEIKVMALKFKQQSLLNGVDLAQMDSAAIYGAISVEENRIKDLEKIEHKPKSLVLEIASAKDQLTALVAHLDSK